MSDASKIIFFYLWCGLRGHEKTNPHKNIEADPLENRVVAGVGDRRAGDRFAGRCGASLDRVDGKRNACARSGGLPETDPEILACPFFANDEFVVRCPEGRYTMLYDTAYRQAAWVAYLLTRRDVSGKGVKRSGVFKSDPEVIARGWPSAADRDYTGSGFDRGHLLPSADRERYPAGERGYVPFVERFAAAAGTEPRDVAQAGRTGAALGGALRFALHRDPAAN